MCATVQASVAALVWRRSAGGGGSWLSAGRRRHTTPIQRWFGLAGEQRPQGATARGCAGHPRRSAWLCRCWYVSGSWPSAQYSLSSAASCGELCMVRRRAVCTGVQLTGTSAEQPDPARLGAGSMGWWRIVSGGAGHRGRRQRSSRALRLSLAFVCHCA